MSKNSALKTNMLRMYRLAWVPVLIIGVHLVLVSTLYPNSWNCSTEPQVPCIAYDIFDVSKPPESDYFCLEHFPLTYKQVHWEQGTSVSWTFTFNDTTIDGFCIENSKIWRSILLQKLDQNSFPFSLNLTTWIADNITEDDDDVYIYPLMTEPNNWNHVTRHTNFFVSQKSSRVLKIGFTSDKAGPNIHFVECLAASCDSHEPAVDSVLIQSNEVTFSNLTPGNYCFKFTPQDPSPLDSAHCLCYYGSTNLRQCSICGWSYATYTMKDLEKSATDDIEMVPEHTETMPAHSETVSVHSVVLTTHTDSNKFPLVTLLGTLSGCIVVVALILVAIVRQQVLRKLIFKSKLCRRKILILAVYDSISHMQSVECFSHCLKTYCRCNVDNISIDVLGKETRSFQNVGPISSTFDVVIVFLSHRLLSLFEEVKRTYKDNITLLTPKTDLAEALLELHQTTSKTACKIVTLHFSGLSKTHSIISNLSASDFHLLTEFERLLLNIHSGDHTMSDVSKQCSEMMMQLRDTDKFNELKDLVCSVERGETSTGKGKTSNQISCSMEREETSTVTDKASNQISCSMERGETPTETGKASNQISCFMERGEISTGKGKTSNQILQSLNVDSGKGSSLSRINIDVNTRKYDNIYGCNESIGGLSNYSVWSDSGRKHHDDESLVSFCACLSGVHAKRECDVCSLTTVGEFSV